MGGGPQWRSTAGRHSLPPMTPDYLLLGHFTRDLLPDGSYAPGGTSLYAATAAYRLGRHVGVVSTPTDLPADFPAAIALAPAREGVIPTFENRYGAGGRVQTLHAGASRIGLDDAPAAWRAAPTVHLGPILDEVPEELVFGFPGALVGVTPQGWMRDWKSELPARVRYRLWNPQPAILERIDALVLSIEDVSGDEGLVRQYAALCRLIVLTRGALGATLLLHGKEHHVPAFPVEERDPTGAGDVFAAAFFVRLSEVGDPFAAARFAACTAALSVRHSGIAGIPTRAEVERHLRRTDDEGHDRT